MKNLEQLAEELQKQIQNGASISDIVQLLSAVPDITQFLSHVEANDFESACKPLMKYLCENHHPHIKVIVEGNCAVLLEGQKSFNTNEYILD
jgi:hypothetical protein